MSSETRALGQEGTSLRQSSVEVTSNMQLSKVFQQFQQRIADLTMRRDRTAGANGCFPRKLALRRPELMACHRPGSTIEFIDHIVLDDVIKLHSRLRRHPDAQPRDIKQIVHEFPVRSNCERRLIISSEIDCHGSDLRFSRGISLLSRR